MSDVLVFLSSFGNMFGFNVPDGNIPQYCVFYLRFLLAIQLSLGVDCGYGEETQ